MRWKRKYYIIYPISSISRSKIYEYKLIYDNSIRECIKNINFAPDLIITRHEPRCNELYIRARGKNHSKRIYLIDSFMNTLLTAFD